MGTLPAASMERSVGPVMGCPMNAMINIHHGIPHGRLYFMECTMVHI